MALTECVECKRSVSSEILSCIHCGAPIAARPAPSARATPLSFGQLPRDEHVPEIELAMVEPEPGAVPASTIQPPVSRHRRRGGPAAAPSTEVWPRPVEVWLKIMVFLLPMVFVWFLLRRGHSLTQRLIGFGWLALMILVAKL